MPSYTIASLLSFHRCPWPLDDRFKTIPHVIFPPYSLHERIPSLHLALSGCSAVYVDEPIGESPLELDPETWKGTWIAGDGAAVIEVGALSGKIDKGKNVTTKGAMVPGHWEIITTSAKCVVLDWEKPAFLRRLHAE